MARKGRIPKKIGGVKLPKSVRKPAEKLIAKASTPEGRRVLAAGLAMAASALATRSTPAPRAEDAPPAPPRPPVPPVPPVPPEPPVAPPTPPNGVGQGTVDPGAIADAVGKAASAFIDGFLNRRR